MARYLAALLVLGAIIASASFAEARPGSRAARAYGGKAYGYQAPDRNNNSAECDRARDADPAGDYASYPCWAQWAFAPKRPGR